MFCQKLIVSNVILAILDNLKPKIFFVSQPWWPTFTAPSLFKIPPYLWNQRCEPFKQYNGFCSSKVFF